MPIQTKFSACLHSLGIYHSQSLHAIHCKLDILAHRLNHVIPFNMPLPSLLPWAFSNVFSVGKANRVILFIWLDSKVNIFWCNSYNYGLLLQQYNSYVYWPPMIVIVSKPRYDAEKEEIDKLLKDHAYKDSAKLLPPPNQEAILDIDQANKILKNVKTTWIRGKALLIPGCRIAIIVTNDTGPINVSIVGADVEKLIAYSAMQLKGADDQVNGNATINEPTIASEITPVTNPNITGQKNPTSCHGKPTPSKKRHV
ncbi:hypothetical protein ACH5RR_037185 [Cinchona calisaya]|uniref:Uncharacterized protein n=1 Tax=Cinchona calisaya TaxID=153742 RepID=A0ABD2Y7P2_9GENT